MIKIAISTAILFGLMLSPNVLADVPEVKLKKKCVQQHPLVVGESDAELLSLYVQICDKKNHQVQHDLLIQAAQRYQQLGQHLKALNLVNDLHEQNIHSTALTDIQFIASAQISHSAIHQMRHNETRYLSGDQTSAVAKELVDAIEQAKPMSVVVPEKAKRSVKKAPIKLAPRHNKSSAARTKTTAKTNQKEKNSVAKPEKSRSVTLTESNNPFAALKK